MANLVMDEGLDDILLVSAHDDAAHVRITNIWLRPEVPRVRRVAALFEWNEVVLRLPPILTGRFTPDVQKRVEQFYVSIATIFEAWVARRHSPHTQRAYREDAMAFVKFMGIRWPEDSTALLSVTIKDVQAFRVQAFRDELRANDAAPKALNRRIVNHEPRPGQGRRLWLRPRLRRHSEPRFLTELGSVGAYYWGGFYYTSFAIDPREDMVAVFMGQLHPTGDLNLDVKAIRLAYQALGD